MQTHAPSIAQRITPYETNRFPRPTAIHPPVPHFLQTVAFSLHASNDLVKVTPSKQPFKGEHHEKV